MRAGSTMNAATWALLLCLSLLWGGSFFFFKILVAELPPLTIVVLRLVIAAIALLVFLRLTAQALPNSARAWRSFFVMGVINNVIPFTLIVWSEIHLSSGVASVLNATTPVFSVLLAPLFSSERLTSNRLAGAVICFCGVAILIGPEAWRGFNPTSLAQLAVLLASLSYACAAIYGRRYRTMGISSVAVSAGQLSAAAVLCVPLELAFDRPWTFTHAPSLIACSALLGLALLSTAVAYIIYFRILASAGATNALLVTFLAPISALVLGALVLKERLVPLDFAGVAVIFAGLAVLDGRVFGLLQQGLGRAGRIRDA